MEYDFDIFELTPADTPDSALGSFMKRIGFASRSDAAPIALFRDPDTAEALRGADPQLRDWMLGAGFGLNTYDCGAGPHRYLAQDELARLAIIEKLTATAQAFALPAACPAGGFVLDDFIAALAKARPLTALPRPALPPMAIVDETAPKTPRKFWQNRFARVAGVGGIAAAGGPLLNGPPLGLF